VARKVKGQNVAGSGKGQKGSAPKRGGIKNTSKHEFRSNFKGMSK
jgi:hypothetical protein